MRVRNGKLGMLLLELGVRRKMEKGVGGGKRMGLWGGWF
jgi:hypothetical protein